MKEKQTLNILPKAVVMNSFACYGKCALTVAIPVISAFGVETVPLPTVMLSTHTGGFGNNTRLDLTEEAQKIITHWKEQQIFFDGIYTGYFCNPKQLLIATQFIEDFKKPDSLIIIDPIMGDNGRLYKGFNNDFLYNMRKLCGCADIITPNLTEAAYLAEVPFNAQPSKEELDLISDRLLKLGAKRVIITGVPCSDKIGVLCFDSTALSDSRFSFFYERTETSYHGCGDIFTSALCASMLKGTPFKAAVKIASEFITECIRTTLAAGTDPKLGLNFEACIPKIILH